VSVRKAVSDLAALGPLPASDEADEATIQRLFSALEAITPPLTVDEAILLASSFGPDDCFGIAWTLVHLVESAPPFSFSALPFSTRRNEWVRLLEERRVRGSGHE
jgi:hypothetical protein